MEFRRRKDNGQAFPMGGRAPDATTFRDVASQDRSRKRAVVDAVADQDAIREGELWAMNDSQLYHSTHEPWVKNVQRKIQKKTFDIEKLVPAIEKYYVPRVIQSYKKVGDLPMDKATKRGLARRLSELIVQDAEDRIRNDVKP